MIYKGKNIGECWLWPKSKSITGYGYVKLNGKYRIAHRSMYMFLRGPIPEGCELDHVCKTRGCVNPWHLDPVTHRENLLRGNTISARAAAQVTCVQGHQFEAIIKRKDGNERLCRVCKRERDRRYYQARKASSCA